MGHGKRRKKSRVHRVTEKVHGGACLSPIRPSGVTPAPLKPAGFIRLQSTASQGSGSPTGRNQHPGGTHCPHQPALPASALAVGTHHRGWRRLPALPAPLGATEGNLIASATEPRLLRFGHAKSSECYCCIRSALPPSGAWTAAVGPHNHNHGQRCQCRPTHDDPRGSSRHSWSTSASCVQPTPSGEPMESRFLPHARG